MKSILIFIIKIYKRLLSPYLGNSCRYLPTCSDYFIDSLNEYGIFKGSLMGIKRILSCHPIKFLGGGDGFDPVLKERINKTWIQKCNCSYIIKRCSNYIIWTFFCTNLQKK